MIPTPTAWCRRCREPIAWVDRDGIRAKERTHACPPSRCAEEEARADLRWCVETLLRERDKAERDRSALYVALEIAAEKFREYELLHLTKCVTPKCTVGRSNGVSPICTACSKARANGQMAAFCENTLRGVERGKP